MFYKVPLMSPVVLRTDDGTRWCGEELSARGGGLSRQWSENRRWEYVEV